MTKMGLPARFLRTPQIILSRPFFNYLKINSFHRLQSECSLECESAGLQNSFYAYHKGEGFEIVIFKP
jgi:hypothetical protein